MKSNQTKTWLTRTTVLASFAGALLAPISYAQDTVEPAAEEVADEARQETIVVTGSLIPTGNLVETSPVTAIGADEFNIRGTLRVEDMINTLPQAFGAQGANLANGASGTASVNLRGLGEERTLVLMNGRRLPYGSINIAAPDINTIPAALVQRVDILTGGASAAYGSDAISGVVNFVMNKDFEGVRLDTNYSFYQHNNDSGLQSLLQEFADGNPSQYQVPDGSTTGGESIDITGMVGGFFADGKGHAMAFAGYTKTNEVLQGERDYSQCALGRRNDDTEFTCAGSSTNQFTNILDFSGSLPSGFWARVDPTNDTFAERNFVSDTFNYNPYNHYQRPAERYNFGAFVDYSLAENHNLYSELMFTENETNSQIAPSGVFGYGVAGGAGGLNCDNPFLSAQQAEFIGCSAADIADGTVVGVNDIIALRRNVEGGNRNNDIRHSTWRGVLGFDGSFANNFLNYDVYASFSKVIRTDVYNNDLSIRKLSAALYAVEDDDGNIVCNINNDDDLTNNDAACAPYDIWSGAGPSDAAVAYIVSPLNREGEVTQQVISGKVFGSLGDVGIKLPSADDAPAFAVGVEYRRDALDSNPDAAFQSGDGAGQGGPTNAIAGSQDVIDIFGELNVPIVQGVMGAEQLGVDLAYRRSEYENFGSDSYKIGFDYAPIADIRFRGSFQRAVRAANIFERFTAQSIGLFDLDGGDPCGAEPGGTPALTEQQCLNTGLAAEFYGSPALINPAGQYNTFGGGNPDLDPEESDTYTIGAVFSPSFLPGLVVSLDYFDIEVEGYISTVPEDVSLTQCGQTGSDFFCGLVNRGTGGTLWANNTGFITATNVNTGSLATSGFDLLASYEFETAFGGFNLDYVGTVLEALEFQALPDASVTPIVDCAGHYAGTCQNTFGTGANPEYRHKTSATWYGLNDTVSLTGTWRHTSEVTALGQDSSVIDYALDAQNYFDLSGSYSFGESVTLRAGVNNILDEDPPVTSLAGTAPGNGNTYPQVYDALGRYIFMGLTFDF